MSALQTPPAAASPVPASPVPTSPVPTDAPYFTGYEDRLPDLRDPAPRWRMALWHLLAGMTLGFAGVYLWWRWTQSLSPDAPVFSVIVALAETLVFIGTLLFFHDIWDEGDTPTAPPPARRDEACLPPGEAGGDGAIRVDVFITTYGEPLEVVRPSILAARALDAPEGVMVRAHVLDDANRPEFAEAAAEWGVGYISRTDNIGYKAGNLRNALLSTEGDFVVICDADTRLFPGFVRHTLGYFRDPGVAWVQTPHWFYDIPDAPDWIGQIARRIGVRGCARLRHDPYLSDPALFFDVIQRRRNRHGASFCCGAASIHRREPLFAAALDLQAEEIAAGRRDMPSAAPPGRAWIAARRAQPFRFHVSEDLYTSILMHSRAAPKWRSVYHPRVESRMLSPWSMEAWAIQRFKYAAGTFDIMLHVNPVFRRGMPLAARLHYGATLWSYLSILWVPVLVFAPVFSLITGMTPIRAGTIDFLIHFLPAIVMNELALMLALKGHDPTPGRLMALMVLPLQWRALVQVLRGKRPKFPVTPKLPGTRVDLRYVHFHVALLAVMLVAAIIGIAATVSGARGYTLPFLLFNLFWMVWAALPALRAIAAAAWSPDNSPSPVKRALTE